MMEEPKTLETQKEPEAATAAQEPQDGGSMTIEPGQPPLAAEKAASQSEDAALREEVEALQGQLAEESRQFDELKNRYLSLAAEFDNFRKRTAKEKEELHEQIKGRTLEELLPAIDNFERARSQIVPANDGEMAIHKSYQGVYKILVDNLKRLGVSPMRPEGEPFDPNYHEAMLREPTDEHPEGTILEQLVRGYMLGERVLRHALVKVAAAKEEAIEAIPAPAAAESDTAQEENHQSSAS
jgi:molecular chaperone GrpE